MQETFVIPAVGAILTREITGTPCLLLQERRKENDCGTNGLLEYPAGKVRTYENLFDALRREVWEETGLTVTRIQGEAAPVQGVWPTVTFAPFCTTQNLSGGYSLLLHTFLCEADGETLPSTDETADLRWLPLSECRALLRRSPERFFPMSRPALERFLGL